jgi:hypothetical protein
MSNDATNGYAEVNGLNMYYERHEDGAGDRGMSLPVEAGRSELDYRLGKETTCL